MLQGMNEQIEVALRPDGHFAPMPDFASKMQEHVCRWAAIFHVIENKSGTEIGEDDARDARQLIYWYACEFDRLIVRSMAPTQEARDADLLYDWFIKKHSIYGNRSYIQSYINRMGPNSLRSADRLKSALLMLQTQNKIWTATIQPTSP
jgi:hypothetical protein